MPAMYGGIFAQDKEFFECTMRKAYKRLNLVAQVYSNRTEILKANSEVRCLNIYEAYGFIEGLILQSDDCSSDIMDDCVNGISEGTRGIRDEQNELIRNSCIWFY